MHEIRFGLLRRCCCDRGQVLYFIESNTRSATIIGIVGAGGIGLQLAEQIRVLEWQRVSFLILMILIAVAVIDWISSKLRFAIIRPQSCGLGVLDQELDRSAAKRARLVTIGLPEGIDVGCVDDHDGRPSGRSRWVASVASAIAAVIRVVARPVIPDTVMGEQFCH